MKKRILLVEDDKLQREALLEGLSSKGFDIIEAVDGEEGVEVALKEKPDLILTDVRMPKLNGIDMISKIRRDDWGKDAKVIILTNYDHTDAQLNQIVKDQPSYYLMKTSNSLDKIVEKINDVLKPKEK